MFARGYLAVDFFFVLSGFVLTHAYYGRLSRRKISLSQFYRARLIRLLPLIVLGTLIAAVIESERPGVTDQAQHGIDTIAAFIMGSLILPIWWTTTLENVIFPLNGPVWSLFFEVFINLVAAPLSYIRRPAYLIFPAIAISAFFLVWAGEKFGNLNLGFTVESFWYGFARVTYSFFVGVALYFFRNRAPAIPLPICTLVLAGILAAPVWSGIGSSLFEIIAVLIVFPLIVLGASAANPGNVARRICLLSGEISYPIYALHYPLVRALGLVSRRYNFDSLTTYLFVACGTVFICIFSGIVHHFYDVKIRRFLQARAQREFR